MDPEHVNVSTGPLALIEVSPVTSAFPALGRALSTYGRSLKRSAVLMLVLCFPVELLLFIVSFMLPRDSAALWIIPVTRISLYGILGALCAPALIYIFHATRSQSPAPSIKAALIFGSRLWARCFVYRLQAGVYILLGTLAFIVPGAMFVVMGLLIDPVVAFEQQEKSVWHRSRRLTEGMRIKYGSALALVVFLQFITTLLLAFALTVALRAVGGDSVAAVAPEGGGALFATVATAATRTFLMITQQIIGTLTIALSFELYLAARATFDKLPAPALSAAPTQQQHGLQVANV